MRIFIPGNWLCSSHLSGVCRARTTNRASRRRAIILRLNQRRSNYLQLFLRGMSRSRRPWDRQGHRTLLQAPACRNLSDAQIVEHHFKGGNRRGDARISQPQRKTGSRPRRLSADPSRARGSGNAARRSETGKEIFFGKGDCGRCHTISGQGGFLGPDLTNHAMTSSAEAIREEIVRSPRVPAVGYRMAVSQLRPATDSRD